MKFPHVSQLQFLKEVRKQFMTEFDYRREAASLRTVHNNLKDNFKEVWENKGLFMKFPHVLWEGCGAAAGRRVLHARHSGDGLHSWHQAAHRHQGPPLSYFHFCISTFVFPLLIAPLAEPLRLVCQASVRR